MGGPGSVSCLNCSPGLWERLGRAGVCFKSPAWESCWALGTMGQPGLLGPDARAALSPRAHLGMAQCVLMMGNNPGPRFPGIW